MLKWAFLLLCFMFTSSGKTQSNDSLQWWNPATTPTYVMEGQAWPHENANFYARLPERMQPLTSPDVYFLGQQNAGLILNFNTNAPTIKIQYRVKDQLQFPHMPAMGVSGIDLYEITPSGEWKRAAAKYLFADTIQFNFSNLNNNTSTKHYKLYLPLYNSVQWLQIGVPKSYTFSPQSKPASKPIFVFGTSIVQGACASRAGMAWTAILGRKLGTEIINLGFSGNGKLEPVMIELMAEKEASLYILDCMPNLAGVTNSELQAKITTAVKLLHSKRPQTPILLVAHLGFGDELSNAVNNDTQKRINTVLNQSYALLKKQGIKNLYLLSKKELNLDGNSIVDQIHPNDLGMMHYAEAFQKIITAILHKK